MDPRQKIGAWERQGVSIMACALIASLYSACTRSHPIQNDGNALREMRRYEASLRPLVHMADTPLYILHQAGSYREYPRTLNGPATSRPPRDIASLMDMSFGRIGAQAIEIDVHAYPADGVVSVTHDPVDERILRGGESAAKDYCARNSLSAVIGHFIQKAYHRAGRHIFIELKFPRAALWSNSGPLSPPERARLRMIVDAVNRALDDGARDAREAELVASSIHFISFNYHALEAAAGLTGVRGYGYTILLATNRPVLGRLAMVVDRDINWVDEALTARVAAAPWLNGIWFDPWALPGYAAIINGINARRSVPCRVALSAYHTSYDELVGILGAAGAPGLDRERAKLAHVAGIIFDVSPEAGPGTP